MTRTQTALVVTAGTVAAGGVIGALSGVAALGAVALVVYRIAIPTILIPIASAVGASLGACLAPLIAWTLLREVPIGRAIIILAAAAGIGGAIGLLVGLPHLNPYEPFSLLRAPLPQAVIGASLASVLAATVLRLSARKSGAG